MIDNIADAIPQNVVLSDAERSAILEIGLLCIASDRRVDPDEEKAFRAIAKKLGETKTDAILGKLSDSPTREEADARLVALAGQLASDPAKHLAYKVAYTMAMADLAADNLIAALGEGPRAGRPPNPINPDVIGKPRA